jgi:glycosyltransferase 2 family protein
LWGKPGAEVSALLSRMGVVNAAQRLVTGRASIITSRRVRILAQVLLVCALAFVLLRLRSIWSESRIDLSQVSWPLVVAAGALAATGVVGAGYVWLQILRRLGVKVRQRWVGIFLETQIGKYIPGSVWHYAGRTALTRVEGVAVGTVAVSVAVELAASVFAGAVLASLVLGVAGVIVTAALISSAALAASRLEIRSLQPLGRLAPRVSPADVKRTLQAAVDGTALYVVIWAIFALAFWLMARALFSVPASEAPFYMGVYGVACCVGLVAFFAPVGFGVREALIVALLRPRLGTADALVLAAASRLLLTIVDVGTAGAGVWLLRRDRRRQRSAGDVHETDPRERA